MFDHKLCFIIFHSHARILFWFNMEIPITQKASIKNCLQPECTLKEKSAASMSRTFIILQYNALTTRPPAPLCCFVEAPPSFGFLTLCSLGWNKITSEGACKLAGALQVNHSFQELKWVQALVSYFFEVYCECRVFQTHTRRGWQSFLKCWINPNIHCVAISGVKICWLLCRYLTC